MELPNATLDFQKEYKPQITVLSGKAEWIQW